MEKKAPAVLTAGNGLEIFEVQYIEYAIQVKASIADYNDYQEVYQEIEERLNQYLNPITGNFDGNGFQIGALPNRIKIYNYLKNVKRLTEITVSYTHLDVYKRQDRGIAGNEGILLRQDVRVPFQGDVSSNFFEFLWRNERIFP